MTERVVTIPYSPRPFQREVHENLARFTVLACHRRFGKSVLAINELIRRAFSCPHEDPLLFYIAPTHRQAKLIGWEYLKKFTRDIPLVKLNHTELSATFPVAKGQATIRLFGVDDPDSLRGAYADFVVFDEFALIDPRAWSEVVRPMLADRQGGALFLSTPRGRDHFYQIFKDAGHKPGWRAFRYTAEDTGVILPSELAAARAEMSDEQFAAEFLVDFNVSAPGAYYAALIQAAEDDERISTDVVYDPDTPVEAWLDLGVRDATAVWLGQRHTRGGPRLLSYFEKTGVGLPDIIAMIRSQQFPVSRWIGPHDLRVRSLSLPGAPSRLETARGLGVDFEIAPSLSVAEGIESARRFLKTARFNAKGCADGIAALRAYRSDYDSSKKILSTGPVHDWSSHGADAFRYGVLAGDDVFTRRGRVDETAELIRAGGVVVGGFADQVGFHR